MKQVYKYLVAMTNLYGVVSIGQVVDKYNELNDKDISKDVMEENLDQISEDLKEEIITVEGDLFIRGEWLKKGKSAQEIFENQKDLPYYEPERKELLRYSDPFYVEKNSAYKRLKRKIRTYIVLDDDFGAEITDDIMLDINAQLANDSGDYAGIRETFELAGYSLSMSGYEDEVMDLISDYAPHIRKWEYNGFTEAEMKKQKKD